MDSRASVLPECKLATSALNTSTVGFCALLLAHLDILRFSNLASFKETPSPFSPHVLMHWLLAPVTLRRIFVYTQWEGLF